VRRIPPTLVVLALVLGTAGCGDDKGSALSAEEFVKRANAACVAGDQDLETAGKDLTASGQPTTQQIADFFLNQAVPIARKKLDQIEKLSPPADKRAAVKDMLAAGREAIDEVSDGLKEDPEGYLTAKGPDPFADFDESARDLGLNRCASQVAPGEGGSTTTAPTTATTAPATTPPSS
jgi:hypothetical protein